MRSHAEAKFASVRRIRLRTALMATATSALLAGGALAQDAPNENTDEDEIVVKGIRGSLASSLSAKKNAEGILDAISAEDIGKFPDKNIGEALQRVTGVQITREGGEGRLINIRGVAAELNRVEFNGSKALSTDPGGGRQVDFRDFPAEFVSRLEVYKSQTADMTEGGLGGTVKIYSRKPLGPEGDFFAASAEGVWSNLAESVDPRIAVFGSKAFADGRFGLLGGIVYETRSIHAHQFRSTGWTQPDDLGGNVFIPFIPRPVTVRDNNDRFAFNGIAEFQPNENFNFYAEGLYTTRNFNKRDQLLQIGSLANGSAMIDPDSVTLASDGETALIFDAVTVDNDMDGEFDAGDRNLAVTHRVLNDTFRNNIYFVAGGGSYENDWMNLDSRVTYSNMKYDQSVIAHVFAANMVPMVHVDLDNEFRAPNMSFGNFDIYDRDNINFADSQDHMRDFTQTEFNAKLDGDFETNLGIFNLFEAGAEYTDFEVTASSSRVRRTSNAFNDFATAGQTAQERADQLENIRSAYDMFAEFSDIPFFKTKDLGFDQLDLLWIQDGLFDAIDVPTAETNFFRDTWTVTEKTKAAYAKINFNIDGRFPIDGNFGIRYVDTDVTADGFTVAGEAVTFEGGYDDWLPAGGITVGLIPDELLFRFTGSSLLARAQPVDLAPRLNISTLEGTASRGNPGLDPFRASQFDVSLEWYLSNISYISVAGFRKDIASFIQNEQVREPIPGFLPDSFPQTNDPTFLITQPANAADGVVIKGIEAGAQFDLGDFSPSLEGLGFVANVTYATDSGTPNISPITGNPLPFPGLSELAYNFSAYYERHGLSARLSYNWRDDFLLTPSGRGGIPEFQEAYGQWDISTSYEINDHFEVFADAINLTNTVRLENSSSELRRNLVETFGRRVFFGVRANF